MARYGRVKHFTSEVYNKARDVFSTQQFAGGWQHFIKETLRPTELLSPTGPAVGLADRLDRLREQLQTGMHTNEPGAERVNNGDHLPIRGKAILAAAKSGKPETTWPERVSALKFLRHFYRPSTRGAQDVWVYAPPSAYTGWIFQELAGDETTVAAKLEQEKEIFDEADRKTMGEAVQFALMCSHRATADLSFAKPETVKLVKRWFGSTDSQCDGDVARLHRGFQAITAICNSNTLVFSHRPYAMARHFYDNYGSIAPRPEGAFPVIYLGGLYLEAGRRAKGALWECAATIIHECSHMVAKTIDMSYNALTPRLPDFSHKKALRNAESWAMFCIDNAGFLPPATRNRVMAVM